MRDEGTGVLACAGACGRATAPGVLRARCHAASSRALDLTVSTPHNCARPPRAVIHTVAMQSRGMDRVTAFVVMADRDVAQAVPDQTLQQIITSLRPSPG